MMSKSLTLKIIAMVIFCLCVFDLAYSKDRTTDVPVDTSEGDTYPWNTGTDAGSVEVDRADPEGKKLNRASQLEKARLFLVMLEDNGAHGKKIGCQDSLVAVDTLVSGKEPLRTTLDMLLTTPASRYGNAYYSVFDHASLRLKSVTVKNGVAHVALLGTPSLGGTCDSPRLVEQLTSTILQFKKIQTAQITINGKPLEAIQGGKE